MSEAAGFVVIGGAILASLFWYWLGFFTGRKRERHWWQDEMIRRRHAVFHWENGKWFWNEDEPKTPRDPAATKIAQNRPQILGQVGGPA